MAVRLRPGILKVEGNSDERTVTIEFDANVIDTDQIRAALDEIGYPDEGVAHG